MKLASHKNIIENTVKKGCIPGEIIIKDIATSWMVVLLLPKRETSNLLTPSTSTIYCLIEEIDNSLRIMINTGMMKTKVLFRVTNHTKVKQTNNLSANKSNKAPNGLTVLFRLAI